LAVLVEVERRGIQADAELERRFRRTTLDQRERALALELVYGVLRHRATLDWRLSSLANRPLTRLPLGVTVALRLGAYQLLYLDRIPHSAAVNESVSLAKSEDRPGSNHWSGFANAVLRALLRRPAPAPPSLEADPVEALAILHSCPTWLVARWLNRHGLSGATELSRATLTIPPITIRANTTRISRKALAENLTRLGLRVTPTAVSPVGLQLDKCGPLDELRPFQEGLFYVEDEAAQLVSLLVDPQPDERVLDACAAPGGKATHLAQLMGNRGQIVALDRNRARLHLLEANCRRLGLSSIVPLTIDLLPEDPQRLKGAARSLFANPFDRVLLDAPCSGLGVLRRHPEGKWQKQEQTLARHHRTQIQLLERAAALLRPGGCIVYSTCSTEPEENESVIERFCREHPDFRRESVASWLPDAGRNLLNVQGDFSSLFNSHSMDALFAARLRKAES
jgi:16S rRNA (cytosine967-C5)-methyltransferase